MRRFGQHDHVRYYGDDFEQRLVDAGLVFTRTSPRSLVGERVCTVLGLIPDEWVWVVRSLANADGDSADAGPPVVPPPTGLTRALDAVVEAWTADLVRLSHARRRAKKLRTELDTRSRTAGCAASGPGCPGVGTCRHDLRMTSTPARATELLALHTSPKILTLVNVWDVASARAVAAVEGTRAIATASHGIAATYGYRDGEQIPVDLMLDMVGRIAAAVELPVTADLEAGYGDPADTIRRAVGLGVVGANLEDQLKPVAEAAAAVAAAVEAAQAEGSPTSCSTPAPTRSLRAGDQDRREVLRGRDRPRPRLPGRRRTRRLRARTARRERDRRAGRRLRAGAPQPDRQPRHAACQPPGAARRSPAVVRAVPPARRAHRSAGAGRGRRRGRAARHPHADVNDVVERFREAARSCDGGIYWTQRQTPVEAMAALAKATEELGIDQWDLYAERGAVAQLEREVAELLGKPAAAMFPSGIMAQQAALRVWCDRAGSLRVGIPEVSHLLLHEDDGPRLLHGFRFEHLSTGRALPTVADLERLGAGLAAVLLEVPLRDAGCLLPEWDDLVAITTRSRDLGVPVHVDGARIWESQPFYGRPLAEISGLADSVYVSFYKGLGGLAGACLAGDEDVVDEARRWRKRMGGTLFHLTPYAVLALAGLREHLPRMGDYVAWARALATELSAAGLRVHPDPPQTNTFQLFVEGEADAVNERAIAFMERNRIQPCGVFRAAPVPGLAACEVAVQAAAVPRDATEVAAWLSEVAGL